VAESQSHIFDIHAAVSHPLPERVFQGMDAAFAVRNAR
jgi:hypothetical protein